MISQVAIDWSLPIDELREVTAKRVWKGMESQGFERCMSNGACVYRGLDGQACAAGHCLTDRELRLVRDQIGEELMDGERADDSDSDSDSDSADYLLEGMQIPEVMAYLNKLGEVDVGPEHGILDWLSRLQYLHDEGEHPTDMRESFRQMFEGQGVAYQ